MPIFCLFYCCLTFLFLNNSSLFSKERIGAGWFSEKISLRDGFHVNQLNFTGENKFHFHQLSYNSIRKWEEIRIRGKVHELENRRWELSAEHCAIYAQKDNRKRWVLISTFDCDHIKFSIKINSLGELSLMNPLHNTGPEIYYSAISEKEKGQVFKVIGREDHFVLAWGQEARYVSKKSLAFRVIKGEIKKESSYAISEPIDTIIFIRDDMKTIQESDLLFIEKKEKKILDDLD